MKRWLCYLGAAIALGVGITSFTAPILIAGVAVGLVLVLVAVRPTKFVPSRPDGDGSSNEPPHP